MRRWELIQTGVRKYHDWGYSEVYMPSVRDCFTSEEKREVIAKLTAIPVEYLSQDELKVLGELRRR